MQTVDHDHSSVPTRTLRTVARTLVKLPRPTGVLLAIGWMLVIWFLSAQKPVVFGMPTPWQGVLTNSAHGPEYAALAAFLVLTLPRRDGWPILSRASVAFVLGAVLVYAITDEIHQSFVPDRDASVFDVVTDLVGASLLLIVVARLRPGSRGSVWSAIAIGVLACFAAAVMASFAPSLAPSITWL